MTGEFDLIRRYFRGQGPTRADVRVGIGDDAAVLVAPPDVELVVSTDTLIAGIHFPEGTHPYDVAHKALAANLSDLAAMGADPAWFLLNLTLPRIDADWLAAFSEGLFALARRHSIALVGGDTTRGPLAVTITVHGFVPKGAVLLRSGACPGDRIYVTGYMGQAALGFALWQQRVDLPEEYRAGVTEQFLQPTPRLAEGQALRGLASAAIDVSDGLAADLGHVLAESGVGARVYLNQVPLSPAYDSVFHTFGWDLALAGGDDYELCFTLPPARVRVFDTLVPRFSCGFAQIGEVETEPGLRLVTPEGALYMLERAGYDHFATR